MNLKKLSDEMLEKRLFELIELERKTLKQIILHIQEVSRREIWAARGFSSLVKYLIYTFKYSETAAYCRMNAAAFARDVPVALCKIEKGELHLSQICEMQRSFRAAEKIHDMKITNERKEQIMTLVAGRTTAGTQEICAKMLDLPIKDREKVRAQKDGSRSIEIILNETQWQKFEKTRDKLAHKTMQSKGSVQIADVLETCFDEILKTPKQSKIRVWKSFTKKRKEEIIAQDQCCQYQDKQTQRKCESTFNLQVDHIIPVWAGGSNSRENLQAMCAAHNRHKYRQQTRTFHA